ncbi:MAG TPA: hypothetical protein VM681_01415 [Candidatus Thermoplasmatota archaeon]|nr:hypothetical protein [Candidatus Thermoplasmatota archaeon]
MDPLGLLLSILLVFLLPGFALHRAVHPERRFGSEPVYDGFVALVGSLSIAVLVGIPLGAAGLFSGSATGAPILEATLLAITGAFLAVSWLRRPSVAAAAAEDVEDARLRDELDAMAVDLHRAERGGAAKRAAELRVRMDATRQALGRRLYRW